jgi:hypothetical protein
MGVPIGPSWLGIDRHSLDAASTHVPFAGGAQFPVLRI